MSIRKIEPLLIRSYHNLRNNIFNCKSVFFLHLLSRGSALCWGFVADFIRSSATTNEDLLSCSANKLLESKRSCRSGEWRRLTSVQTKFRKFWGPPSPDRQQPIATLIVVSTCFDDSCSAVSLLLNRSCARRLCAYFLPANNTVGFTASALHRSDHHCFQPMLSLCLHEKEQAAPGLLCLADYMRLLAKRVVAEAKS